MQQYSCKKKLLGLGVHSFLVCLIASFLSGRCQRTKYKSTYSDPQPIFYRVPQSTLLGQLLFLVMINDLVTTLDDRWKYVDDLSLIECCRKHLPSRAGSLMNDICQEANVDKMTVNFDKSVILTFSFFKIYASF